MNTTSVLRAVMLSAVVPWLSLQAQTRSSIQFYDSTGSSATGKIGWRGTPSSGQFFIETSNDGNGITASQGNLSVNGTVTAGGFSGDGSALANLPAPNLSVTDINGLQAALAAKADTSHSHMITSADIQNSTVDSSDIAANAIRSSHLNDNAVTGAKVAANTLDSTDLGNNSVTANEIANGTIGNDDVSSLTSARIAGSKVSPDFGPTQKVYGGTGEFADSFKVRSGAAYLPVLSLQKDPSSLYNEATIECPNVQWLRFRLDHQEIQAQANKMGFFLFGADLNSSGTASPSKIVVYGGGTSGNNNIGLGHLGDGGEGQITTDAGNIRLIPAGGTVSVSGTLTATAGTCCVSDGRYKTDVASVEGVLDRIEKVRCVSYRWNREDFPQNGFPQGRQIGLIAQEVETAFPELVQTDADGYKALSYDKLAAVLVQAVKEQSKAMDEQRRIIDELSARLSALEAARPE